MESILTSVKKMLGITEEYTQFDADIIMHINTVFMILNQLGVGPERCFAIEDDVTTWNEFINGNIYKITEESMEMVKTYMYMKVKMLFDPPSSSIVMQCMNQAISEMEWRLHMASELKKDR